MLGRYLIWIKWKLKEFQITWANILFTIEHRWHNKCLNWEILKFYAQNELISNLMPDTALKIVGTGAYLPWCSISSSFQNSLKTSEHRCYAFLELWCCNLVPFLPDIDFQLLKSSWSSWRIFRSMMCQMFSLGESSGLQAGQFSTQTLLLRSHAVVIAAVCGFALSCWNTQGLPWNRCHLEGSICCSKTFIYLSAFIVPSKTCKLPIPNALMHPHTIRDAGFLNWVLITRWKVSLHVSVISNKNVKFGLVWP